MIAHVRSSELISPKVLGAVYLEQPDLVVERLEHPSPFLCQLGLIMRTVLESETNIRTVLNAHTPDIAEYEYGAGEVTAAKSPSFQVDHLETKTAQISILEIG
jgi:hypothetical protein